MNSQAPASRLSHSSQGCVLANAAMERITTMTPKIQALKAALECVLVFSAVVFAKPKTHGEMKSQAPSKRLSQSCQRLATTIGPRVRVMAILLCAFVLPIDRMIGR